MTLWFTTDTHFGHTKIIEYTGRPWDSVGEMDAALINNWNSVVKPKDEIWHLGDFCFPRGPDRWWPHLNGRINLILGNHDMRFKKVFEDIADWCGDVRYLRYKGLRFFLSHYAHRTWYKRYRGTMHLYGHWHGSGPIGFGKSMDVALEGHKYLPYSVDEVVERLRSLPIKDEEELKGQIYADGRRVDQ